MPPSTPLLRPLPKYRLRRFAHGDVGRGADRRSWRSSCRSNRRAAEPDVLGSAGVDAPAAPRPRAGEAAASAARLARLAESANAPRVRTRRRSPVGRRACASYWPRRLGARGAARSSCCHLAAGRAPGQHLVGRFAIDRALVLAGKRACLRSTAARSASEAGPMRPRGGATKQRSTGVGHALGVEEGDQRLADAQLDDGGRRR